MKNHEGYYDTTAGIAIGRAEHLPRKKRGDREGVRCLMYQVGELPAFRLAVSLILK